MADSNDDLLEDGDLTEMNFEEIDLVEEDALLADDGEEKLEEINDNETEKMAAEDDDYLELGVDEDLTLNDDEVVENGNTKKREPIHFSSHENDDSDENSGGERSRFKSERQIIARSSSTIPETLDAVAVRVPVKFINRGGFRGKGGRGGNNIRKFNNNRNQPTNIHVNPHFRPRGPMGGPGPGMWNGRFHGPPPPPHFQQAPHPPPFGYQPPPPIQPYYGGGQDQFYQPIQQPFAPQPPPPQPQMGWGDGNFYPGVVPPPNFAPPHFPPHGPGPGPGPQMLPPRMRPPFNVPPRPPFIKNKNFNVKPNMAGHQQQQNWGNNMRGFKRDQFHHAGNVPPVKQFRFDSPALRPRSNLQEVKMVDCLPAEALTEEEDEEMKAYRKKIEEQKKLREQLLRQKEENRMVAAQQKLQVTGSSLTTINVNNDGPPGVNEEEKKPEMKLVRIRTADGKTVLKKMTLEEIKKLKKVSPTQAKPPVPVVSDTPSCVVAVENLSASTTLKQLEDMASQIGPLQKVELDREKKTALIRFAKLETAKEFVGKYQRKMVDLSMIGLKFMKEN